MVVRWGCGIPNRLRCRHIETRDIFLYTRDRAVRRPRGVRTNTRMPTAKLDHKRVFSGIMAGSPFYPTSATPSTPGDALVIVKQPMMDCCQGNRVCRAREVHESEWHTHDVQTLIRDIAVLQRHKFHVRMLFAWVPMLRQICLAYNGVVLTSRKPYDASNLSSDVQQSNMIGDNLRLCDAFQIDARSMEKLANDLLARLQTAADLAKSLSRLDETDYNLYAIDVVFDKHMHPFVVECNPDFALFYESSTEIVHDMMEALFCTMDGDTVADVACCTCPV